MISKSLMVLVTVCLVCSVAVSQTKKEVRSKLFKQVLADYPDVRECVDKEEGGTRSAEENMSVEEVDLNRDGVPGRVVRSVRVRNGQLFDLSVPPES